MDRPLRRVVAASAGLAVAAWSVSAAAQETAPSSGADAASAPAPAATEGILPIPDYGGGILERKYLTGDWWDARNRLAGHGVQFRVEYLQHLQGIVSGGLETTTRYGGKLDYLLNLDFQRMGLVPGGLLTVRGETRYGDSVNGPSGMLLPVNTDMYFPLTSERDDTVGIAVTELTYTQFLSPQFALYLGKLNTLGGDPNEFASGRGRTQFQNSAFVFNPVTALTVPYATLGAGALWIPSPHLTVVGSVFNTADSSTTTGFDDFGDGWTISVEAQGRYSIGTLPGGMNLGFLYGGDGDFARLGGIFQFRPGEGISLATEDDTWSVYWSGWQYLWVQDPSDAPIDLTNGIPDRRGIGLFARAGTGDQDTLPIDWHLDGGIGGRGVIPGRPDDQFGVGYFYSSIRTGRIAGLVGVGEDSQGFEAYYNAALTPAVELTFSVQAVESPRPNADTAVILGGRLLMRF